jgi:hypothetical protein
MSHEGRTATRRQCIRAQDPSGEWWCQLAGARPWANESAVTRGWRTCRAWVFNGNQVCQPTSRCRLRGERSANSRLEAVGCRLAAGGGREYGNL